MVGHVKCTRFDVSMISFRITELYSAMVGIAQVEKVCWCQFEFKFDTFFRCRLNKKYFSLACYEWVCFGFVQIFYHRIFLSNHYLEVTFLHYRKISQ